MSAAMPTGSGGPAPARSAPRGGEGAQLIVFVCFLGLCATLLLYAPGYMSVDSFGHLSQARSGVFTDHHPPLIAAIWSVMDRLCAGPFGMLLLQAVLFWGGLALFFMHVEGPAAVRIVCPLLVGLFPSVFGMLGTIWKDVLMLSVLMMAIGLIARCERKRSVVTVVAIVGLLVVASALRHNGVVAVPPLLFWLVHAFPSLRTGRRIRTLIRAALLALVASAGVYGASVVITRLLTSREMHFWQVLAFDDLAGISIQAGTNVFPDDFPVRHPPLTLEALRSHFSTRKMARLVGVHDDTVFAYLTDEAALAHLRTVWFDAIFQHPVAYAQHRWAIFASLMGWPGNVDTPFLGIREPRIVENDFGLVFQPSQANEALTRWLTRLVQTPVYRVWVYVVTLLVLLAIGIGMYWRAGSAALLAFATSGLLYMAALLLLAAASDFRYSLWAVFMALVGVGYLACRLTALLPIGRRWCGPVAAGVMIVSAVALTWPRGRVISLAKEDRPEWTLAISQASVAAIAGNDLPVVASGNLSTFIQRLVATNRGRITPASDIGIMKLHELARQKGLAHLDLDENSKPRKKSRVLPTEFDSLVELADTPADAPALLGTMPASERGCVIWSAEPAEPALIWIDGCLFRVQRQGVIRGPGLRAAARPATTVNTTRLSQADETQPAVVVDYVYALPPLDDDGRVVTDLVPFLNEWQANGGVDARGPVAGTYVLQVDAPKGVWLSAPYERAALAVLAPAHPRDFSIRLSWTGDIRVKLRVSCYRDQARKQLVGHRFVQLQDGLNRFGVYSRDQTLYMYPALSITGKGTLTIESFAVGTWDGAPSSAPTTSD